MGKKEGDVALSDKLYKRDMQICVDGYCAEGMLVVPRRPAYNIKLTSPTELELFSFSTCHREETSTEHGGGWFSSGKKYEGIYTPVQSIENVMMCPVYLGAYDKNNQHAWGFIDFETPEATLPAKVFCNGIVKNYNGVSVCQSKAGLVQSIVFSQPVTTEGLSANCKIEKTDNSGLRWEFLTPRGECTIAFFSGDNKIHRITTYGYDNILLRGK